MTPFFYNSEQKVCLLRGMYTLSKEITHLSKEKEAPGEHFYSYVSSLKNTTFSGVCVGGGGGLEINRKSPRFSPL